jgi:pilus assembly protein Flp/PilA
MRDTHPPLTKHNIGLLAMSNAFSVLRQFKNDEDGAALIEYTVLLAILLIAVVTSIGLIGTWISGRWNALVTTLGA